MKANCWFGKHDVRMCEVPEPQLLNPRDAIVRVTLTTICGSDLHLYDGHVPSMQVGDILGHEFMGEVVSVGSAVGNLRPGDRVVVPFAISCGRCFYCRRELWSLCDNSNPNAGLAAAVYGFSCAALFGYSHMMGGYAGGQAHLVRVPFADVGPLKVPAALRDEQVLFLSDIFPTGYMAAENCDIQPGDVIAVWGCGPVGQFAIRSALLLGAGQVIAIDREPARLSMAASAGAEVIDFSRRARDRSPDRDDGWPRSRCLHRLRGARGLRPQPGRHLRPRPHDAPARDGPSHRSPAGGQGLPQGRRGVDPGRLRRFRGQAAAGRRLQPRASPSRWDRRTSSATCGRS